MRIAKKYGMRYKVLAPLAVLGMLVAACGSGSTNASSTKSTSGSGTSTTSASGSGGTISIGFASALTGKYAAHGQAKGEGLKLAAALINKDGGVLGKQIKIIPADLTDPVDAVPAVRKLLAVDNVKGIIGFSVINYQNVLPITNAAKMVAFTNIGSAVMDNANMPYMFRMSPSDSLGGVAMGIAAKLLGYKRVVMVGSTTNGVPALLSTAANEMKKEGITVAGNVQLPANVTSYQAEAAQVVSLHPDAMVGQFEKPNAGPFYQALRAAGGSKIPMIGTDVTGTVQWLKAAGFTDATDNVVQVAAGVNSGPALNQYLSNFQSMFNHSPLAFASSFYDSLNVMSLAMLDCKSTNPQDYVKCIPKVTTPGPGVTTVYNFADGKKALSEGKTIKYSGVGSPMTFSSHHDVTGPFQVQKLSIANGHIKVLYKITAATLTQAIK